MKVPPSSFNSFQSHCHQERSGLSSVEDAHPDTTWILERSTDLVTFEEIYAFDGTTAFDTEGLPIEVNRTAERITITDQAPPAKGAYYRFRAVLAP